MHHRTRLLVAVPTAMLITACGSSTTSEDADEGTTVAPATTAAPETTTAPETTAAPETTTAPETTAAPETTTAPETTAAPETTTAPETTAAPPAPAVTCPDVSSDGSESITRAITVDLLGDGTADDVIEGFATATGNGGLRLTTGEGVVSEYLGSIEDQINPIDVIDQFPGGSHELVANLGGGDVAFQVALFTTDGDGCLTMFTYSDRDGEEARFLIQPSGPVRSGAFCFDGVIASFGAEEDIDGTWFAYGAAFETSSDTQLQYQPASDDYSEGLDESELGTYEFDCGGVVLR